MTEESQSWGGALTAQQLGDLVGLTEAEVWGGALTKAQLIALAGGTGSGGGLSIDALGLFSARSTYNSEPEGFVYLATDNGNLYVRQGPPGNWSAAIPFVGPAGPAGPAGTAGAPGAPGADGRTILSGAAVPAAGLGVDGDFYIRTGAWTIYGPKAGGAWGAATSIIGPTGATGPAGPTGPTGPTGPASTTPGPTGPTGPTGAAGPTGPQGPSGQGVPAGGTTGQVLRKINASDFNTEWANPPGGAGGSGNTLFFDAAEFIPRTTSASGVSSEETATNRINRDLLTFDPANQEFAQKGFAWPDGWSTATATFFWKAAATGDCVWSAGLYVFSDGDAEDQAFSAAQSVTDAAGTANTHRQTAATAAITPGGAVGANKHCILEVFRNATNGADTLPVDALLIGVLLTRAS